MKIRKGRCSGKVGVEVYVNTKHGQVVRSRPSRPIARTRARLDAWNDLAQIARLWRSLPDKHAAWEVARKKLKKRCPGGKPVPRTAFRLFCMINGALKAAGQPRVKDPPKLVKFEPNPVGRLKIGNRGGVITLRLRVPRAPAKLTFVLGSKACSAGISMRCDYAKLGLLPAAERGWSDITVLYVQKFGVPKAGQRVFIQTRQMIGGWEDAFKTTYADVPQPEKQGS